MEKVVILLAVFVGMAMAFYDQPYVKTMRGARSASHDNAEATAHCRKGYILGKCSCEPKEHCDGAWIKADDDGKEHCVAYNAKHGHGVQAVAHCRQLLVFVQSAITDMPSVECPDNYKLVHCQLHTYYHQHYPDAHAKRHRHSCYTSKGCHKCRVQARCLRNMEYELDLQK